MITLKIFAKAKSKVMIDNNVDRMSVNILPFSLDRALSVGNRKSEDPDLFFIIYRINQDQDLSNLSRRNLFGEPLRGSCSLRTDKPGFFVSIFSSLKSGKEVSLTLIINDGTLE